MPFARSSLTELRQEVAQDIAAALPGSDPLLRFSNLNILGIVQATLAYLQYGYADWIAQQAVPFTATQEFLEAWAALKAVIRAPAAQAEGSVTLTGSPGATLPASTMLTRSDGKYYFTTAPGTVSGGSVTVPARAVADKGGLLGAFGNCDPGTIFLLSVAVAGINSQGSAATAFTGGADIELDDAFRSRMFFAYQQPPHGGSASDYVLWARQVPGVTRAWCVGNGMGVGTVVVYAMLDDTQAAHAGFPQGTNGCAVGETRDTQATGDQLRIANHIYPLQPVTALVYVKAPTANTVAFTIAGIPGASADTKAAIAQAIADVFRQYTVITAGSSTVDLSYVEAAIAAVPNTAGFLITTPAGNIVSATGQIPVVGTITYT